MSDVDGLQSRVAATAERLATAQAERRQRNRSLLDTLARLEEKFAAQQQEIAYYRGRVRPLEAANQQLSALMGRLLDMVDAGLDRGEDGDDPVQAAASMAAQMLDRDLIPVVSATDSRPQRFEDVEAERLAAEDSAIMFEDVDVGALAQEAANDVAEADLPDIVRTAHAAAQDDVAEEIAMCAAAAAEEMDEEIDAPGMTQPSAADIHALLQRVEAAAARMAGSSQGAAVPDPMSAPAPDRRLVGAA